MKILKKIKEKINNNRKKIENIFFGYLNKNTFWYFTIALIFEIWPMKFIYNQLLPTKSRLSYAFISFEVILLFLITILAIISGVVFLICLNKIKKNCDNKKLQNPCWVWWTNNKPKKSWILYLKIMNWSAFVLHLVVALLNMTIAVIYFKNEFVFIFTCLILPITCTIINFYLFYRFILKINFSKMI